MTNKLVTTLGADPEVFLFDHKQGRIISSLSVIPNTKHDPIILDEGMKMYSDNVLVETAFRPSWTANTATITIRDVLAKAHAHLGRSFSLVPIAAHTFDDLPARPTDEAVMQWLGNPNDKGESVPLEWQVGCNPNFDVYVDEGCTPRPQSPFKDGLRTGSFHIHIGNAHYKNKDEFTLLTATDKANAVMLMDIFVGLAAVATDNDPTSTKRKALYGKAGEFRPTPYGIEYRVLGNYCLRSPSLTQLMFEITEYAMGLFNFPQSVKECIDMTSMTEVQRIINTGDRDGAHQMLVESWLPSTLYLRVAKESNKKYSAEETIKNWGL